MSNIKHTYIIIILIVSQKVINVDFFPNTEMFAVILLRYQIYTV